MSSYGGDSTYTYTHVHVHHVNPMGAEYASKNYLLTAKVMADMVLTEDAEGHGSRAVVQARDTKG